MTPIDPTDPPRAAAENVTLPLVEERAAVSIHPVETVRARIHIGISERDEAIHAMLLHQDVSIHRVPVGTPIAAPPPVRTDGDTLIVSILEERLVTETRLFLKEELHIRIDQARHPETRRIRLRSEHADIEHHPKGS